jgi:rhodanese-related sulfurtransferase
LFNDLEITPHQLAEMLKRGEPLRLIDVREPSEYQQAHLQNSELVPMGTIPSQLALLEADERPLMVLCHHGVRSLHVVCWLREQGVENCRSVAGGIDRWSREVDPEIPRY